VTSIPGQDLTLMHKHTFDLPLATNTRSCLAYRLANIRSPWEVNVSAVAYQYPHPQVQSQPRLQLVPELPRPTRLSPAVYRRRRIAVATLVVAAFLAVAPVATAGLNWAWHEANPTPAVSAPVHAAAPMETTWTVRPGDTLWGIARSVQPTGDLRPLLSKLMAQYKNDALQVGDTIAIPR
jgi:hypothetical protein